MKIALTLVISTCGSLGLAQTGSADRTTPATDAASQNDGFIVKILRPMAPSEKTTPTAATRLKEYELNTIGAFAVFRQAAAAGVGQAEDNYREWGEGARGYGERLGNDLAINALHHTISYGAASLFNEDNRYFSSGKTSVMGRLLHAAVSPFETHHEDGSAGFSYSNVIGVVGSNFISRAWAPPSERGPIHAAHGIAFSFAGGAGLNAFREFVPDIIRKVQKR